MNKITLQPGEAVEINGAIIGMEIVDKLLSLQLGIDSPGNEPRRINIGLEEDMGTYQDLIMFLASEAQNFNDETEALKWFSRVDVLMDQWNAFRVPGTGKVKP
jgi:hypothetical protein